MLGPGVGVCSFVSKSTGPDGRRATLVASPPTRWPLPPVCVSVTTAHLRGTLRQAVPATSPGPQGHRRTPRPVPPCFAPLRNRQPRNSSKAPGACKQPYPRRHPRTRRPRARPGLRMLGRPRRQALRRLERPGNPLSTAAQFHGSPPHPGIGAREVRSSHSSCGTRVTEPSTTNVCAGRLRWAAVRGILTPLASSVRERTEVVPGPVMLPEVSC